MTKTIRNFYNLLQNSCRPKAASFAIAKLSLYNLRSVHLSVLMTKTVCTEFYIFWHRVLAIAAQFLNRKCHVLGNFFIHNSIRNSSNDRRQPDSPFEKSILIKRKYKWLKVTPFEFTRKQVKRQHSTVVVSNISKIIWISKIFLWCIYT